MIPSPDSPGADPIVKRGSSAIPLVVVYRAIETAVEW
jgi:hypothetical protein